MPHLDRRLLLRLPALAVLSGCAAPWPDLPPGGPDGARALLDASAAAHGADALTRIADLNVAYSGEWRRVVGRLQPALVDAGFRGRSEERLLLRERLVGQAHAGPDGRKQVVRQAAARGPGTVRTWYNGTESTDVDRRHGAALVADAYALFLLGPMLLAGQWAADRSMDLQLGAPESIDVGGRTHACDVVRIELTPGFGLSEGDRLAVYVDRAERLMRRARFTLNGLEGTRAAVAEVDTFDHVTLHGVRWPTGFYERLLRPLPLPVHDWRLTGLDVNRGLDTAEITGPAFTGRAVAPAALLSGHSDVSAVKQGFRNHLKMQVSSYVGSTKN